MNDQDIEDRLRASLALVDRARFDPPAAVAGAVERALTRHRRRRRNVLLVAAAALVAAVAIPLAVTSGGRAPRRTRVFTQPTAATAASTSTTLGAGPPDTWRLLPADPRGTAYDSEVVWTGREAVALGGRDQDGRTLTDGAAYDPARDTWRTIAQTPDAVRAVNPLVAWTGKVVLVIGGDNPDGSLLVSGASAYDPARDTWQTLASPPIGYVSARSPWVWTGTTLLVWPSDGGRSSLPITPIAYDPAANTWNALAPPSVERRQDAASVWSGTEWIVWGGRDGNTELADGAAYAPATATWRVLARSPLAGRHTRPVWTGTEMIVAAGASGPDAAPFAFGDGAAYNPRTDTWRPLADGPAHPGFAPVWTGKVLLSFFKHYEFTYDPAADRWTAGPDNDEAGVSLTPVWTGSEALVLGGTGGVGGGAFTPPS